MPTSHEPPVTRDQAPQGGETPLTPDPPAPPHADITVPDLEPPGASEDREAADSPTELGDQPEPPD
jgi:hypothetical protein